MVESTSIIGLTISLGHVLKSIYGICATFSGIDDHVKEICLQLSALQDVLSRISSAMQFEPSSGSQGSIRRFASHEFQELMVSTSGLVLDLEAQLSPPARGKWTQAAKQRISWMFEKKKMDEFSAVIAKRIDLLGFILSSEHTALTQKLYSEVRNLSLRNTFELRKDLVKWLGAPDYYSQHTLFLNSHQPETGSWFTSGPLSKWLSEKPQPRKVLWLQDKSGSGKSYLAANAIESTMRANDDTSATQLTVLYFYCSSGNISTQSTGAVLASFIQQMCERRPELWNRIHLESQKTSHQAGDFRQPATIDQLTRLFKEFTSSFQQLCVFLDALNESNEPESLLGTLRNIIQEHRSMRICIFSTPELSTQQCAPLQVEQIQVDIQQQRTDLKLFIENSLRHDRSLAILDGELKSKITDTLLKGADGSFKWVEAVLKSLADQDTIFDVECALASLPPTLEKSYRDTLSMIPTKDRIRVRRLLRWLTVQIRPLTIKELSEAVVINANSVSTMLNEKQRLQPGSIERYLKIAGSSLVQYNFEEQTVQLAHSSARDFLTSYNWQGDKHLVELCVGDVQTATETILRACLWYLLQEPFQSGASGAKVSPRESWPLFDYCAQAWPVYFQNLYETSHTLSEIATASIARFINSYEMPKGGNYGYWLQKYAANYVPQAEQTWKMLTPLHLAASQGWTGLCQFILQRSTKGIDIIAGENQWTPLLRACLYNHEEAVRYLLQYNADPAPDPNIKSRIQLVISRMTPTIQKLLTDALAARRATPPATPSPFGGQQSTPPEPKTGRTVSGQRVPSGFAPTESRVEGEKCAQQ